MPNWIAFADGSSKLLAAITALLWPVIVAIVAWKLLPYVREVLKSRNFSIEVAGLKIGAQDFSEQVRLQIEDLQRKVSELRTTMPHQATAVSPAPTPLVPPSPAPQLQSPPSRILWVDDHPENNAFAIARLKSKNIDVVEARSTAEGLQSLTSGATFGAVISDVSRREEGTVHRRAGFELIDEMKNVGIALPVLIYTSTSLVDRIRSESTSKGVWGVTASPVELFEMLRTLLGRDI